MERVQTAANLVSSVGGSQGQPGPPILSNKVGHKNPVGNLPAGESVHRGRNYHVSALSGSNSWESITKSVESVSL